MLNKPCLQIVILLVLGLILGFVNNTVSPNKIPWVQEYMDLSKISDTDTLWRPYSWEPSTDSAFKLLNTKMAYQLFYDEDALFVDARLLEEYEEGHIAGAINVDFDGGDDQLFEEQLANLRSLVDENTKIICYCNGAECDASLFLARYLYYDQGFPNVSIYFGGWNFWIENGLPIEPDNQTEDMGNE